MSPTCHGGRARSSGENFKLNHYLRLRFYAGLSVEQTAGVLDASPSTVKRKWLYARAWLYRELTAGPAVNDPRD